MFSILNDAGIASIFKNAITILKERGHTKGATFDPSTGKVDVRGAILLAAGAKPARIAGFVTTPEEANIAQYWIPKVYAAFYMLDNLFEDMEAWNDNPATTQQMIEAGLQKAANLIEISIT